MILVKISVASYKNTRKIPYSKICKENALPYFWKSMAGNSEVHRFGEYCTPQRLLKSGVTEYHLKCRCTLNSQEKDFRISESRINSVDRANITASLHVGSMNRYEKSTASIT